MKARTFNTKKLILTLFIGLAIAIVMVTIASLIGSSGMSVLTGIKILASRLPFIGSSINLDGISASQITIVLQIRLPRALAALVVGGGLAVCGSGLQGMFKNPLADSGILGISSGAALGAGVAIVLKIARTTTIGLSGISLFAFVGGITCVLLVYYLSRVKGKINTVSLLLSGTAISAFSAALLALVMMLHHDMADAIFAWTMGSLHNIDWKELSWCTPIILIGTVLLFMQARELNLLLLGEDEAKHLGVNTEMAKLRIMILTAIICSAAVSVSGIIGFVGLIIPHVVRLFSGPDHRYLIPISFIVGGIFLLLVDTIAKTVVSPLEINIGVITSVLGGPFFIYLLRKRGRA